MSSICSLNKQLSQMCFKKILYMLLMFNISCSLSKMVCVALIAHLQNTHEIILWSMGDKFLKHILKSLHYYKQKNWYIGVLDAQHHASNR